jgi:hypothetical protein
VVLVVDSFAEFRRTRYLMAGCRRWWDGRQFGIYFVLTANTVNDLPNKLYNLLTQRRR